MRCGRSTSGFIFQMHILSLQPASMTRYSSRLDAAKSMKRSYVAVLSPFALPWLSKSFHHSQAALPGFTHEKSAPFAAGAASA